VPGRLQRVLPQASIEEPGLFLYFPRYASETAQAARLHRHDAQGPPRSVWNKGNEDRRAAIGAKTSPETFPPQARRCRRGKRAGMPEMRQRIQIGGRHALELGA